MFKNIIFLALALFASTPLCAGEQETNPAVVGALKSVDYAIQPNKALGEGANELENTFFLKYGRPGSETYNNARMPYNLGFLGGAGLQAAAGFVLAKNLYHTSMHEIDIYNKVSARFPGDNPRWIRQISVFVAAFLNIMTLYSNKIEPAYSGYYWGDEQVLSDMLPIALVPMSVGYLIMNAGKSFKNGLDDKNFFNKIPRSIDYLAAVMAAITLYFYSGSGPNIDRYTHEVITQETDLTEFMLGGLWFWLLLTNNQYISGAFGKVGQLIPGQPSDAMLRAGLASATVLARSAYAGFDMGDITALTIGGLTAWGLHEKNPKILLALASLIAAWSALGAASNTLVFGYSQTNTIN